MTIEAYPSPNGVLTSLIWRKTATGGETSLSGYDNANQALSYTPGQEQVYLNGILLVRGDDYIATNGTSITNLSALVASDYIQVNCYNNFSLASLPSTSISGTIANNQLANSAITINGTSVSLGGSYTVPGDIESVTAGTGLSGGGSSGAVTLSINTSVTADLTTAQTLTNKDLTSGTNTFPTSLATLTGSQTLTNKTLTDPKINQSITTNTSTSYTVVLTDNNKIVTTNNASAQTIYIPTNASVAFPVGARIDFAWITGAGQPTITATSSGTTTILSTGGTSTSPKLRVVNSMASAVQIATDIWLVTGDVS